MLSQHLPPEFEQAVPYNMYWWPRTNPESISKPKHATYCGTERHIAVVSRDTGSARRVALADQNLTVEKGGKWAEKGNSFCSLGLAMFYSQKIKWQILATIYFGQFLLLYLLPAQTALCSLWFS